MATDDWKAIHDFVVATWDLHEQPMPTSETVIRRNYSSISKMLDAMSGSIPSDIAAFTT